MNYYDSTASGYIELHRDEQMHKLRLIRENISLKKGARVLDVGCGPCWSFEFFENVTGVDPSRQLLALSKNKNVRVGRAEELPFADHSFDFILCVSAIHHFDLALALSEMRRVATLDALFVITVLKKAKNKAFIIRLIKKEFVVEKEIDELKDVILICRN